MSALGKSENYGIDLYCSLLDFLNGYAQWFLIIITFKENTKSRNEWRGVCWWLPNFVQDIYTLFQKCMPLVNDICINRSIIFFKVCIVKQQILLRTLKRWDWDINGTLKRYKEKERGRQRGSQALAHMLPCLWIFFLLRSIIITMEYLWLQDTCWTCLNFRVIAQIHQNNFKLLKIIIITIIFKYIIIMLF